MRKRTEPRTMAELGALVGVSAATVSRAIAGSPLVNARTRAKILSLAQERGYVVNAAARSLRLKRTETISVVIPLGHESSQPLTDPFFVEILGRLAEEITLRGYGMFLQKVLPPMADWLPRLIGAGRADGIIVIGQSTEHATLTAAAKTYRPLVVWGADVPRHDYCTVGSDNRAGAVVAVNHLVATGRSRILFLGDPTIPEIGQRYAGYRSALKAAGFTAQHEVPAHLTAEAAYRTVRALAAGKARFDAIFAASDVIAISAIRALTDAGRSVPRDVAVVGFDGIAMAAHTNPPLTTVRQDLERGAKALVDLVFRRIAGEDTPSVVTPTELLVRESSTPARGATRKRMRR
ncbi:MAG: LacI family DNA-binding transcriptional regulator [Gammaproteobacteria bacterium]